MTLILNIEDRKKIGKMGSLLEAGILPAVYYGKKESATPIQIKKNDFLKIWKEAGESTVITLKNGEKEVDALIHDVYKNPLSGEPNHIDFYVFEKGHKVEISVPIEFVGVSLAVKEKGAILVKVMHEIKIKAEPSKLPHKIEVDTSALSEIGDDIKAKDVKMPNGVELSENPEEIIANVALPKEEKEEVVVDLSKIEVEKKGKKEEEPSPETSSE